MTCPGFCDMELPKKLLKLTGIILTFFSIMNVIRKKPKVLIDTRPGIRAIINVMLCYVFFILIWRVIALYKNIQSN